MFNQQTTNYSAVAARVLMVILFFFSGVTKLTMPAATIGAIGSTGAPFPELGLAIAVAVELVGGVFILLGYKAKPAAIVLALYCIATAIMFHNKLGDHNNLIHFLKNLSMAGGFLQVAAFGAGGFSLDARRVSAAGAGRRAEGGGWIS